jgi:transposase
LPNQSKNYGKGLGLKSKTDKIDARMLSQTGLERDLRLWQPLTPNLRILKQLTRERDRLVRERRVASSHKHAYSHQGKPYEASIKAATFRPVRQFVEKGGTLTAFSTPALLDGKQKASCDLCVFRAFALKN